MDDGSWRTLEREYVYRSPWSNFRVDEVRLPGGKEVPYGVLECGGFVSVVAVTDGGGVLLVCQWRQPLGGFTLELPSGGVDAGEEPREAAHRELSEEAGYRAEEMEHLVSVYTSTGRSDEVGHLFLCEAAPDELGPQPEPTEHLQVVELPFEEAFGRAMEGGIVDAASVIGLLMASRGR